MDQSIAGHVTTATEDRSGMHAVYLRGGRDRQMAPHVVYREPACPHAGCDQTLQAIDFRLEDYGRAVHDALVRSWWDDAGFAGRCPTCDGWILFTVREKRAIGEQEALQLPRLPDDWHVRATIL